MTNNDVYKTLDRCLNEPRLGRLYETMKAKYAGLTISHNWEHVLRVALKATRIGAEEKADLGMVLAAAFLHDIGFLSHPKEPKKHNEYGAKECVAYLSEWSAEEKSVVSSCILRHKGKYPGYEGLEPETLEEKVLCDADQVDKFGWIGLLQVIKVYDEYGSLGYKNFSTMRGLGEGIAEASRIELYTDSAKKMALALRDPPYADVSKTVLAELAFYEEWNR